MSNFRDILSENVAFKLLVNLKPLIEIQIIQTKLETQTSFNKFKPSKNGKTDRIQNKNNTIRANRA